VNSSVFWFIAQRKLVKHRSFGTTKRFYLDESGVQEEISEEHGGPVAG
jgi:hypothetical protein